ncbi:MAG: mechanosensitive ion channel family protein [Phormidesmis sp.]
MPFSQPYKRYKHYVKKLSKKQPLQVFIHRLTRPVLALVALGITNSGLSFADYYLPDPWNDKLAHIFTIAIIFVIGWMIQQAVNTTKVLILRRYATDKADNFYARRVHTQVDVIAKIISFFVVVLTLAAVSLTFEEAKIIGNSLLASAGVASIILGLAAQKTIGNLFAGIQIAITRPICIEDAVFIEGEWGWIEEINLTYVVVRIWDLRRLVVPITYFSDQPFQNWTRNNAEIIGSVVIYTDYAVPIEAIRSEMNRVLDETPLWNRNIAVLQAIDCEASTLQLRALMTGKDAPTTWDLRCHVREKLVTWLANEYPTALPRTRMELKPAGHGSAS